LSEQKQKLRRPADLPAKVVLFGKLRSVNGYIYIYVVAALKYLIISGFVLHKTGMLYDKINRAI